ncbi:MAG: hypothetical protein AB7I50_00700 [Vicinamibacterales bacterium]
MDEKTTDQSRSDQSATATSDLRGDQRGVTRRWRAVLSHERQPQILYSGLVCILERSPEQWTSVVDVSGYSPCDRESTDRHAHLIAAAPEMLEALRAVTKLDGTSADHDAWAKAHAAIAKAEGR